MKNQDRHGYRKIAYQVTAAIAAANVIVFLILSFQGMTEDAEFMLAHGAMYVPRAVGQGEYYRLFTSMFLHFGFEHLMNNMVVLLIVGSRLEAELGKTKYLFVYLAGGLCGSIVSALWDIRSGNYAVSAGASGAVFALIGALFYIAVRSRDEIGNSAGKRLAFMVLLMLYYGFTSAGVDNAAHVGGLLSGFILSVVLYRKRKRKHSQFAWNG